MSKEKEHIEKIRREKFWLDEKGQLREKNPLIDDLINSIERLSEGLYSKDTHFIFELIQNAEDNTYNNVEPLLSFQLVEKDPTGTSKATGALIVQNNEIGFTRENVDAICAIGKSTKNKLQGYIGEKGIGFKSVFRITTIPHIFSNGYQFCFPEKDEKTGLGYIVPQWISEIPPQIDPKQTNIILPLDKPDFNYERVKEMLYDIKPETILFLSKLKEIQIKTDSGDNLTILKDDSKAPYIQLLIEGKKQEESYSDIKEFLVFTQTFKRPKDITHEKRSDIDIRDVTIAFPIDNNEDSMGKIFAYLPIRSDTGFPFIINADFILPSSREDIQDVPWNRWLMECVAKLLVGALPILKNKGLLTVKLLEALAKKINELDESSIFYPLVEILHNAFLNEELLPAHNGTFVSAKNANLAESDELRKLLSPEQLKELFSIEKEVKWLSPEITEGKTPELCSYLKKSLHVREITSYSFARKVTEGFLKKQSIDWMSSFYQFLNNHEALWRKGSDFLYNPDGPLRNKPFIRLQDGAHVLPFKEDGSPNVYLPPEEDTKFPIVAREIAKDKKALEFLKKLGLTLPDEVAEVIEHILPKYREDNPNISDDEHIKDIEKILKSFKTDSQEKKRILIEKLKNTAFIKGENIVSKQIEYKKPEQLYFRSEELNIYFAGNEHAWFVWDGYDDSYKSLFKDLGVYDIVHVRRKRPEWNGYVIITNSYGSHKRGLNGFDPDIKVEGLKYALTHPTTEKSKFIWNEIVHPNIDCIRGIVECSSRKTYEDSKKENQISKNFGLLLINIPWLPDKQGDFHKPAKLRLNDLPESFFPDERIAIQLGMKRDVVAKLAEEAGVSQDTINIAKELENYPDLLEEFRKKIQSIGSDRKETKSKADINKIDYENELQKAFNRPGKTKLQNQMTDDGKVINAERRREKSYEEHKRRSEQEPESSERRKETIRTILEGPDEQVREYLFQFYAGKCQICGKTFPERDGKPFFIANYIVPRNRARFIDTPANALCLCADHFAKWQHGAIEADNILGQILNFKTQSEGGNTKPILRIKLCGKECEIKFVEKHLVDLQELIRALKEINREAL